MKTLRLTAAQACVRYLANQYVETDAGAVPYFAGVWAIFGHGNVAGIGEALEGAKDLIPTFRAHNEQAMAHSAVCFLPLLFFSSENGLKKLYGPGNIQVKLKMNLLAKPARPLPL